MPHPMPAALTANVRTYAELRRSVEHALLAGQRVSRREEGRIHAGQRDQVTEQSGGGRQFQGRAG